MKNQKVLIGLFIVGGCILGGIFNPHFGIVQIPVEIQTNVFGIVRRIFQFTISIYVLFSFVLPEIKKHFEN